MSFLIDWAELFGSECEMFSQACPDFRAVEWSSDNHVRANNIETVASSSDKLKLTLA